MIRKSMGISRSLVAIAVLAAAFGCKSDSAKDPGQQLQSPTSPLAGISITIGASRSRLQVGDDTTVSVISVQALRTADWTPLPTGTDAAFTATLGAIDSPSGGRSVTIDLVNGKGSITLYPGTTEGTARVSVTIQGVTAVLNISIAAAGEPGPPAPTSATLTFLCTPSFFDEDGAGPFSTTCTASVLGSDGNPFSGASIFMVSNSGLGAFTSSSAPTGSSKTTGGAGQVTDTLTVSKADLLAFPGSSFSITAHMGVQGGERTASFTLSIVTGTPPPAATNLELAADPLFVTDDGGDAAVDLTATVYDQYFSPFAGAPVLFSTTLGTATPASVSTDGSGEAASSVDLKAADIANHPTDSFTVTAKINTSSGVVTRSLVVAIVRVEAPKADNVILSSSASFILDDGGADETLDLTAFVQDQFGAAFLGGNVAFSSSFAGASFAPQSGATNGAGELDSTATFPAASVTAHPTSTFTITATLTRPGQTADTSTITITIIRPPVADFSYAYVPPATSAVTVVQFTGLSNGGTPTSWDWDFDVAAGASSDSPLQNPLHDFAADACGAGPSCSVKLTVANAAGSSSITKVVTVPTP